ncbi:MAG: (R)-hydratase [Elusimicrobia bacterium]|nr:(R)-hydratase [Elusimicrobiota bacterium]
MKSPHSIREGRAVSMPLSVTAEDMDLYLHLSGDDNPVHFSDAAAQSRGLKKRVVYGGLLVSAISRLLGTKLPGPGCVWQSLSINFRRPLHVGEQAEVRAAATYVNSETGVLRLKIEILRGTELIADGQAQAGFPPSEKAAS